jgi:hypothetical protein
MCGGRGICRRYWTKWWQVNGLRCTVHSPRDVHLPVWTSTHYFCATFFVIRWSSASPKRKHPTVYPAQLQWNIASFYRSWNSFNLPNPSRAALWTQQLTGMRNLPGVKARLARKVDNLVAICEPIVKKIRDPRRLTTRQASTACHTNSFPFFFIAQT